MKLSEYKSDAYYFSGKASDITRQLSFAGIAVIWIFRQTDQTSQIIPERLLLPLILFVLALCCDLIQYVYSAIVWHVFHRYHEHHLKKDDPDPDILASNSLNYTSWVFLV